MNDKNEDFGTLELADILDSGTMQSLMDEFHHITGMCSGIADLKGNILASVGWRDICSQFHRVHPETLRNCVESDSILSSGVTHGEFKLYRCKNNLWEAASPIVIDEQHLGKIFFGQFFYDDEVVDTEQFRIQAKRFGFDEDKYLAAVDRVPRYSRETVKHAMRFHSKLAKIISSLSYSNILLSKALSERTQIYEEHKSILQFAMDGYWLTDAEGHLIEVNETYCFMSGYSEDELLTMRVADLEAIESPQLVAERIQKVMVQGSDRFESQHRCKDGTVICVEVSIQFRPENGGNFICFLRDITERRQAQSKLEESEDWLIRAQKAGHVGIWSIDLISGTMQLSEEAARFHGLSAGHYTKDELYGTVPAEDRPRLDEAFEGTVKRGLPFSLEYRINNLKTGEVTWIDSRGDITCDEQGTPIQLIGTALDITNSKQAADELLAKEQFISAIADTSPAIIYVYDLETNSNVYVNSGMEGVLGFSPEEIQNMGETVLADLLHPDDAPKIAEFHSRLQNSRSEDIFSIEYRMKHRNGAWIYLHSYERVFLKKNDGSVKQKIGVAFDITEKKNTENLLKKSEEKYRQFIETASDAVYLISDGGEVIDVNQAACNMLGRNKDEMLKLGINGVDPNFTMETFAEFWQETPLYSPRLFETSHVHKDESLVPVEVSGQKFKIGNEVVFFGIARDITDRKVAQAEQDDLQAKLMQSQKMESIGNLAGGIAHEFNNMLAIIMGNNELIREEIPEGGLAKESTEDIRIAGLRAREVVKQLLTFSRQDNSFQQVLDLKSVVQESMKLIRSSTPVDIKIEQKLSADSFQIIGNDTQINQVLINLCNNAIYALPDKGGVITIELTNETINIQQIKNKTKLPSGKYAKLIVTDNGIGMEKMILNRVFEPYYTTKDVGEGTGIGLAVVHGIVERHGGTIIVDSKPGRGTSFIIYLPVYEAQIEQEPDEVDILPVGDEHILYVDDEISIAKLGKRLLEGLGYTTESTNDPNKALEMVRNNPNKFDLLITDMAMPNLTGDQLVIETLKIRQDMPTIICTGYSSKISQKEAMDIGASSFVMKPINKLELAKAVRKVLDDAKGADPANH